MVAPTRRTLGPGDTGDDVREARLKLNAADSHPQLTAHGEFGSSMREAALDFQASRGLKPSGLIDMPTWTALDAVSGTRVPPAARLREFDETKRAASKLLHAGDHAAAKPLYEKLYFDPHFPPEMRKGTTLGLAECHHALGDYARALSLYSEGLEYPAQQALQRRSILQRMRECRQEKPPGVWEAELAERAVDPTARSHGRPLLALGSRAPEMRELRLDLNAAGAADPELPYSGPFDAAVHEAVVWFQQEKGLGVDGAVGPQTWAALDTISGSRVHSTAEWPAIDAKKVAASTLLHAGKHAEAKPLYEELYFDPKFPPSLRGGTTMGLAECHHALGAFDQALSLYAESLEYPDQVEIRRRSVLQRMRECREHEAPGAWEAELADRPVDPNARNNDHRLLRVGDTGDDVFELRLKLNAAAAADPPLPRSHTFDRDTHGAVETFQRKKGLSVDGVVGSQTWAALDAISGSRVATASEQTALNVKRRQASALLQAGQHAAAKPIYEELYFHPRYPPDLRDGLTLGLGECHHAAGDYSTALSHYREALELPLIRGICRRSALQRIRECRMKRPPGPWEADLARQGRVEEAG